MKTKPAGVKTTRDILMETIASLKRLGPCIVSGDPVDVKRAEELLDAMIQTMQEMHACNGIALTATAALLLDYLTDAVATCDAGGVGADKVH